MEILGKVVDTFSAKIGSSGLPRPQVDTLSLVKEFGIEGDKFAGDNLNRTVMIIGTESYQLAKKNGIDLQNGSYGENILLDFDPHHLDIGEKLSIGETELEITEKCTVCSHLAVFGKALPKLVAKKRGLYCKIIDGGKVEKNLEVTLRR